MDRRDSAQRAKDLVAGGDAKRSLAYFMHAVNRAPTDVSLLRQLVDAVQRAHPGDTARTEWLEAFLRDRVLVVEAEQIEEVLKLADSVAGAGAPAPALSPEGDDPEPEPFKVLNDELEKVISRAERHTNLAAKAYVLQVADSMLRQIALQCPDKDAAAETTLESQLGRIRKLSESVSDLAAEADDREAWIACLNSHRSALVAARTVDLEPASACTQQLERLQHLAAIVQDEASRLRGRGGRKDAKATIDEFQLLATAARERRQKKYDSWAMSRLKEGFEKGAQELGVFMNDHEDIATALVTYLAPIDIRLCSHEVQRSYTEVFEYLLAPIGK